MTSFDLDLDDAAIRQRLRDLKEDYTSQVTFTVGTNVDYAVVLEFGRGPVHAEDAEALRFENENGEVIYRTSVSGHPPYPFFWPAIRELQADPEGFLLENTELNSLDGIDSAEEAVRTVAFALERQMKQNASANSASDRSPGTHPEHPQRDTGHLVASIQATRVK